MHSESILKNMLETPNNVEAWQICKVPRHFATTMVSQFAMSWMETITRPKVYVQWGGASELSNYDDSCRTTVDLSLIHIYAAAQHVGDGGFLIVGHGWLLL